MPRLALEVLDSRLSVGISKGRSFQASTVYGKRGLRLADRVRATVRVARARTTMALRASAVPTLASATIENVPEAGLIADVGADNTFGDVVSNCTEGGKPFSALAFRDARYASTCSSVTPGTANNTPRGAVPGSI